MKHIICSLALISSVMIVGCNDSSPVGSESIQPADGLAMAAVPAPLPGKGTITLDRTVQLSIVPSSGSTPELGFVSGTAKYTVALSPILVRDYLTVRLSVRATLTAGSVAEKIWFFSGTSNETVLMPAPGQSAFLVKAYQAHSSVPAPTSSAMTLCIKYRIVYGTVSVESMWVIPNKEVAN